MQCLLDTNIVSAIIKRSNALVIARSRAYRASHQHFSLSVITRYEVYVVTVSRCLFSWRFRTDSWKNRDIATSWHP